MSRAKAFEGEVFDRGRRGDPLRGCDCMQCFGYCMLDHDVARREFLDYRAQHPRDEIAACE